MPDDIEFNFPPRSSAPLIDWLPEDVWLEECPTCQGRCHYCMTCMDLGYIEHDCGLVQDADTTTTPDDPGVIEWPSP